MDKHVVSNLIMASVKLVVGSIAALLLNISEQDINIQPSHAVYKQKYRC